MQITRVTCPKCKSTLEVKSAEGITEKSITCPKCGAGLLVRFRKESETTNYESRFNKETGELQQNAHTSNTPSTEGGTVFMNSADSGKMGKLLYNGVSYPLQIGINTSGRKATTSPATVQIATTDRSMSRSHAIIEVSKLYDGRIHTVIRNSENKNPTFVSGHLLIENDRIILNNGDVIQMGEVTMTFVL